MNQDCKAIEYYDEMNKWEKDDLEKNKNKIKIKNLETLVFLCWEIDIENKPKNKKILYRSLVSTFRLLLMVPIVIILILFILSCKSRGIILNYIEIILNPMEKETMLKISEIILSFSTLLVGSFFAVFWNERKLYSDKWEYAASVYNRILFDVEIKIKNRNRRKRKELYCQTVLAFDLLFMKIYNDEAYYSSFEKILRIACWHSKKEEAWEEIEKGGISYDNALLYISTLKVFLKNEIQSCTCTNDC